jgi:hypothetical protein
VSFSVDCGVEFAASCKLPKGTRSPESTNRIQRCSESDEGVGGAFGVRSVRAIGAIDADTAFALADGPLNGINHKTGDKVNQEARKMDVKRFLLFFRKFSFNVGFIRVNCRVVIILVSGP